MSGITGIHNIDGRPVDRLRLQQVTNAIAHRGPDGIGYWLDGPVGFGHLMLHTTPESLHEKQPLSYEPGSLCLTLDGRVDNREELRAALESKGYRLRADTDAELVLRAYECWGDDCPQHLLGDFAFAIWDGRQRKLFCARDPVGLRSFYYVFDDSAFTFSSELHPLLDTPGFQRKVNLGMLGEYLCDQTPSLDETLYQNILRLPPAHRLALQNGALRVSPYFRVDPGKTIRYASDAEYAEHFYDIFRAAVRARLRSHAPVALFLSGGVDSSSILGMAARLAEEGIIEKDQIAAYHLAHSRPEADERIFVDDLARMWSGAIHAPSADGPAPGRLSDRAQWFRGLPEELELSPMHMLYNMARRNGSRVILWGNGADEWLTGDPSHCADLIRRRQFRKFWRQFRHDVAVYHHLDAKVTFLEAVRWCLVPLVPRGLKSRVKRILKWNVPAWITSDFSRAISLQDRLSRQDSLPVFPAQVPPGMCVAPVSGYRTIGQEVNNQYEAHCGLEGRSPFCDRRLIEFALALPEQQRWRDDQTKYVLRQAMRGLIPDSIRLRRTKGDFTYMLRDNFLRQCAGEAFQSLQLAADGYIDAGAVRKLHKRHMQGDDAATPPLWAILALERWIKAV
jgi:asparagine synthase (glutamine-hydrolysing)